MRGDSESNRSFDRDAILAPAFDALAAEADGYGERRRLRRLAKSVRSGDEATNRSIGHALGSDPEDASLGSTIVRVADGTSREGVPWLQGTLAYPVVLFVTALIVLCGLSLIVIPEMESMFDSFGLSLPGPTRLVFMVSHGLWSPIFWGAVAVLLAGIGLIAVAGRVPGGVRLPLVDRIRWSGSSGELVTMSRFCRALAASLSQEMSVPQAIEAAAASCGDRRLERSAAQLIADAGAVRREFAEPVSASLFPGNVLVAVRGADGESREAAIQLLRTLAEMYRERAAMRSRAGSSLLAAVMIIGVAILIGFTYAALMLPLVQLITGLT